MRLKYLRLETCIWLVIALLYLYFCLFHAFDDDELQHCHNAYLIWKGLVPYRDFFEHHLPLYHILVSPFFILGEKPSTIFAFRFISLVSCASVFLLVYRYIEEHYTEKIALFSIMLLASVPMYLFKMIEARPESIAILFFAGALIHILSQKQDKNQLFFAGVLSGLMVCFSLKYIFAWAGLCASIFVLRKKKGCLNFTAGFLTGIIPLVLYVLSKGILNEFISSTFVMNIKWKYRFSPSGYLYETFMTAGLLIAFAISAIIHDFSSMESRKQALAMLLLVAGCFLTIILVPVPYRQSYLPLFVTCTICASSFIMNFFQMFQNRNIKFTVATVVFLCATANSITVLKNEISQTNLEDIKKMKKVDIISPDTSFFDGRSLMFYRMHTGYYGFMHHELLAMLDPDRYSEHVIEAIKKNNFPVVIYDYRVKQMPWEIQDFIQANYCLAEEPDIYIAGKKIDRGKFYKGKAYFEINVSGWYRILFSGNILSIDSKPVKSGEIRFFEKGTHVAESTEFIDNLKVKLEKRR